MGLDRKLKSQRVCFLTVSIVSRCHHRQRGWQTDSSPIYLVLFAYAWVEIALFVILRKTIV